VLATIYLRKNAAKSAVALGVLIAFAVVVPVDSAPLRRR
jgi:hypothetical protein